MEWLIHCGEEGQVRIPLEIYEELKAGAYALSEWTMSAETEAALLFDEAVDIDLVRRVIEEGYAPDLTDIEIEEIGRDPFLVAYALANAESHVIVTTERSKPKAQRKNRKVPDVARQFDIRPCTAFEFGRELGFRTDWRLHVQRHRN